MHGVFFLYCTSLSSRSICECIQVKFLHFPAAMATTSRNVINVISIALEASRHRKGKKKRKRKRSFLLTVRRHWMKFPPGFSKVQLIPTSCWWYNKLLQWYTTDPAGPPLFTGRIHQFARTPVVMICQVIYFTHDRRGVNVWRRFVEVIWKEKHRKDRGFGDLSAECCVVIGKQSTTGRDAGVELLFSNHRLILVTLPPDSRFISLSVRPRKKIIKSEFNQLGRLCCLQVSYLVLLISIPELPLKHTANMMPLLPSGRGKNNNNNLLNKWLGTLVERGIYGPNQRFFVIRSDLLRGFGVYWQTLSLLIPISRMPWRGISKYCGRLFPSLYNHLIMITSRAEQWGWVHLSGLLRAGTITTVTSHAVQSIVLICNSNPAV